MVERYRVAVTVGTVLCALLLTSVAGTVAAQPDCSTVIYGEDAEGDKLVENVEQLQCISEDPVGDYKLDNDIDATDTFGWNDGAGFEPIGVTFRGTFDGDGYSISGLYINRTETSEVGLFASTSGDAVIQNVVLENVQVTGESDVGGLVGRNEGEVRGVHVTGTVTGERGTGTGGVVGRNIGGVVTRSSSSANVVGYRYVGGLVGRNTGEVTLSYTEGTIEGDDTIGGLVGYNLGTIRDTYSTADAEGRVTIAGLVGRNRGTAVIRNSYSAGTITGTTEARGFVAGNSATVESSYFDEDGVTEMGNPLEDPGGTSLTTDEMTGEIARQTMTGFDFDGTWETVTDGYPVLVWQTQDMPDNGVDDDEGVDNGEDGETDDTPDDDDSEDDIDGDGDDDTNQGTDGQNSDGDGMGGDNETDDTTGDSEDDGMDDDEAADGTEETGDDGGEGMPGFGVLVAVAALVAVGLSRRFDV